MNILRSFAVAGALAASACAPMQTPRNAEPVSEGLSYQAQYRAAYATEAKARNARSMAMNAQLCMASVPNAGAAQYAADAEVLSRGDLLDVIVADSDTFSGQFEVSRDGMLKLPYIPGVEAQGRSAEEVEEALIESFVRNQIYRGAPKVSVRIADFTSALVHVSGAVFEPGSAEIGRISGNDRDTTRMKVSGASTEMRNLSAALRAVGGIRPDADLSRVAIRRGGATLLVDARPAVEGRAFSDLMLAAGDEIEVPSRGCFQEALMAPTSVTAPGVKVFMSNLTQPASANALSAIGKEARELRYGTRFIQAVVGMNCVGGTQMTNADRYAVLFSRNPITGNSIVIERRIEELLRSADRDDMDPFIMPGDAIACYDSTVTNIMEVAKSITQVMAGAATGTLLLAL